MLGRSLACFVALVAVALGGVPCHAAEHQSNGANVTCRACAAPAWHITESKNFRVLIYATAPVPQRVCDECESLRDQLCDKWFGPSSADETGGADRNAWSPKCDVILHMSAASYVQAVGGPGAATVASSLVDHDKGQIRIRRIDVRGQDPSWQTAALPHELTHVVLADRFAGKRLPRWADEGIATLADPIAKQEGHLRDLRQALSNRNAFRVVELLNMDDYPPTHRWAAFYGQSVSITKFLVDRGRSDQFLTFVEVANERGYEAALREVYQIGSSAELERVWIAQLSRPASVAAKTSTASEVAQKSAPTKNANLASATPAAVAIESLAAADEPTSIATPIDRNVRPSRPFSP